MAKETLTVARILTMWIEVSGVSRAEIAKKMGYEDTKVLDAMEKGTLKMPLNMVKPFAEACGGEPAALFQVVLEEYAPDTWAAFQAVMGARALTDHELEVLDCYRVLARDAGKDIPVFIVPGDNYVLCKPE